LISATGKAAAFLVVGAHDDRHIFQRDDDQHRPEDQAENAVNVERQNEGVVAGEGFAEGVDWDVPISPNTMPTAPTINLASDPDHGPGLSPVAISRYRR
jgi:hypothetical protein